METTETNKKLADFLNELTYNSKAKNIKKAIIIGNIGLGRTCINTMDGQIKEDLKKLDFHYNWNSLMRAVEKIESLNISVLIGKNNCVIEQTFGKTPIGIGLIKGETKIEAVYKACIEFVEWWNKEQFNNAIMDSIDVDEWAGE